MENKNMETKDILEKVRDILENKLGNSRSELEKKASLLNDLGADSLDVVELIMIFERDFNIKVDAQFDGKLLTINDFVKYIENYIKDETNELNKKYFNA